VVLETSDERKGNRHDLVKVDIATGAETPLAADAPSVLAEAGGSVALAPDGASVFMDVPAESRGPAQVARVRLSDGAITRLTTDLDAYSGVSRAGDSLVTTRDEVRKRFWVGDGAGRGFTPAGSEAVSNEGDFRIAWTEANTIAYAASLAGGSGLWTTDLASGASQMLVPAVSRVMATADGHTIVFDRGRALWRADADGTHASQLPGATGSLTAIAPDGSAVFYVSGQSGLQTAWTTDLHGGTPQPFVNIRVDSDGIAVSPDSRLVAVTSGAPIGREALIVPIRGGPPIKHLPWNLYGLQWTPDGKALASINAAGTNIQVQPIDGAPAHDLTQFTDQTIFAFGWSPDGKRLAIWRGTASSDIVMLKGIR
jgi:hypothetical protein